MKALKLFPDDTNINFIGVHKLAFFFSFCLIAGAVYMLASKNLNFGIDFTGGTMIEVRVPAELPDLSLIREKLNTLDLGSVSIQEFGRSDDLLIRLGEQKGGPEAQKEAQNVIRATMSELYQENSVDYRRVEFVGPQVGEELKRQGLYAVLFALGGILIYIWLRFEWQFGVAAIVALSHDMFLIMGLFAFTQMEFNLSTVAAILMIGGYSINDTVVVFDRIRENLQKYKKKPLGEVFNLAINQMLSRTLMTSITTLIALVALWFFGGEVIRGFVDALIFGIVIGTYSSVFVAAPILLYLNIRRSKIEQEREGVETPA